MEKTVYVKIVIIQHENWQFKGIAIKSVLDGFSFELDTLYPIK